MFGLIFICDILSGLTCLIKGVIYLKVMYQLIKSPITLKWAQKFGKDMLIVLGQMLTKSYLIKESWLIA